MSQVHDQHEHGGDEQGHAGAQQEQQHQQTQSDGHAGQGSESAMKQMRVWEQHRASHSGGKHRGGPV